MKNYLKTLALLFTATLFFASCNKTEDFDYDEYYRKEAARVDSTLNAQKPVLRAYALEKFTNPVYDDSTGIWFEILETATDNTYQYTINTSGQWITPVATVSYKGQLMNGTVFDEPSQPVQMNIIENNLIAAWPIAFRPKKITFNSKEYHTGLIEGGLKKGHKIRFIAPSPYCYDTRATDKIPANSPLVFEIKVTDIK